MHSSPPKNQKNQIFEKMKKICWRYNPLTHMSFLAIFLPFTPRLTLKIKIWKKMKKKHLAILSFYTCAPWVKVIWWMVPEAWSATQTEFLLILYQFLSHDPPHNPKNENFEKMRKTPEDITTLPFFTTNDNHMMYGFWDIKCNTHNFFLLWTIFYPFTTTLTTKKIKILKKWEIAPEISSFYTSVP